MFTIGCHMSTKKGFLNMAVESEAMGANSFQYFTRNPRGGHAKPISSEDIAAYNAYAKEHGFKTLMAYAPYDIEPATSDQSHRDFALLVMTQDLARLEEIPGQMYLVRPGSAMDTPVEEALKNVADAINQSVTPHQTSKVLICTMPGSGTQVGVGFEQIAAILDQVEHKDHVGVCLDASAVWAAGYDIVNDLDGVLEQFDKTIGLDKLLGAHLNDCKEPRGHHAVRHAPIGEGTIGFEALAALVNHPRLADTAFYIEEPKADFAIYDKDIKRFKAIRKN